MADISSPWEEKKLQMWRESCEGMGLIATFSVLPLGFVIHHALITMLMPSKFDDTLNKTTSRCIWLLEKATCLLAPLTIALLITYLQSFGVAVITVWSYTLRIGPWLPTHCPGNTIVSNRDVGLKSPNRPCYRESAFEFLDGYGSMDHDWGFFNFLLKISIGLALLTTMFLWGVADTEHRSVEVS